MQSLKSKQQKFQATLAVVFALAAGVSFAVVAPQRTTPPQHASAPAVTLPTIVVKPDAADIAAAKADLSVKSDSSQARL